MTAIAQSHYGFRQVTRMEWIKLRSLRSTWWTLAATVAGSVGLGVAVGLNSKNANGDVTNNVLAGIAFGLLLTGVLGVLAMTGEYSSGMIRSTMAAVPNRRLLLAAKATVFGAVALTVGELASFISFFAGVAALPSRIPAPTFGQPHVLRAVLLTGVGYALIGLLGLGLGTIIRHTPAAVAVMVGGVYVGAQFLGSLSHATIGYIPVSIVANSLAVVKPLPDALPPWTGFGVLVLYTMGVLGLGAWLFARRDA